MRPSTAIDQGRRRSAAAGENRCLSEPEICDHRRFQQAGSDAGQISRPRGSDQVCRSAGDEKNCRHGGCGHRAYRRLRQEVHHRRGQSHSRLSFRPDSRSARAGSQAGNHARSSRTRALYRDGKYRPDRKRRSGASRFHARKASRQFRAGRSGISALPRRCCNAPDRCAGNRRPSPRRAAR